MRDEVREGERVQRPPAGIDPRLGRRRADAAELVGPPFASTRQPRPRPVQRRSGSTDLLGPHPAAPADELRALLAPAERHARELRLIGVAVELPAVAREVAAVGVDAERQVGEVAQVGQRPGDVVGGMHPSSSALTPSSSKRRAARPNASPSGPPQCWP